MLLRWPLLVLAALRMTDARPSVEIVSLDPRGSSMTFGDITVSNITRFPAPVAAGSDVATLTLRQPADKSRDVAVRAASDAAAVLGSIVTGAWGTAAVVCVVALVATAGVACYVALATAAVASVFGVWFAAYTTLNPRDDVDATSWRIHANYTPTAECNLRCQLKTNAPHGAWTHFGNVTSEGVLHNVHFYQNGSAYGLRIHQSPSALASLSTRTTVTIQEGWEQEGVAVSSLYWGDDSEAAFEDWNSNTDGWDAWAGDTMGTYISDNEMGLGCLDLNDNIGTVVNSVWVTDVSDTLEELSDDQITEYLGACNSIDPYNDSE